MVFETLIKNAIRYSSTPRLIRICYQDRVDSHCFSVSDNGIGMAPKDRKNLFRPFYLADGQKLARLYDRVGLNLSISKRLIEKLGGQISVESDLGKGSTFTVTLPKTAPGHRD
jgi:signal transduction histidine kinase